MGYSLNIGIDNAKFGLISYLPADDYYFPEHLMSLYNAINSFDNAVFVFSGIKIGNSDIFLNEYEKIVSYGIAENYAYLQLVQVMHIKTNEKWVERDDIVTSDYYEMYWHKFLDKGNIIPCNEITAAWTLHPYQRSKLISEKLASGINKYRNYYKTNVPIKFKASNQKIIDEKKIYSSFHQEQKISKNSLKILLVGELAYNPERIYALEEAGHTLYGLWSTPTFGFNTIGPLPFGHVKDIPYENWYETISEIKPDIIYALLNFTAVPLAFEVLKKIKGKIPFVWHFKEGASISLRQGSWNQLMYLYTFADGRIFINKTVKEWYERFIPIDKESYLIMDGDLPKKEYFGPIDANFWNDNPDEIHTFVAGRIIGIDDATIKKLAENNIHIHLYLESNHENGETYLNKMRVLAPNHIHIHPHCPPDKWINEFSKYDAGWLHIFNSINNGDILQCSWDDLNIPARINTYQAAGVPVILKDNKPNIVSTQIMVEELNIGIIYKDINDLVLKLKDKGKLKCLKNNVMNSCHLFYFDNYVPSLTSFFFRIINKFRNGKVA